MSDQEPGSEGPAADILPSWGFHLLQELHRMEDKLETKIDATHGRIDALDTKLEQKFEALDTKFTQRIDSLQYWYGATLNALILGFAAVLLTHR